MEIDCMGMGGNGNVKIHSRTSLVRSHSLQGAYCVYTHHLWGKCIIMFWHTIAFSVILISLMIVTLLLLILILCYSW